MSELIHEIEESLRQERLHAWWKEYGPYLIAGCVLAVIFTGLSAGWREWQARVHARQTDAIAEASAAPDAGPAMARIAPPLKPSLRGIALLNAAGALSQSNDNAGALKLYAQAAADRTIPEPFHDLAVLQDVRFTWAVQGGKADGKTLIAALQPVIGDAKSPWQGEARITAALAAAHLVHDPKLARGILAPLLQAPAPAAAPAANDKDALLRTRATALDHVYQSEEEGAAP